MSNPATPAHNNTAYRPGKPPTLVASRPVDLQDYFANLEFFFSIKATEVPSDKARIHYAGNGLLVPELRAWFNSRRAALLQLSYVAFRKELLRRALPRDYAWTGRRALYQFRQGPRSYGDFSTEIRQRQVELGTNVVTDEQLLLCMLMNMDPELCEALRKHELLKGTEYHEEALDNAWLDTLSGADDSGQPSNNAEAASSVVPALEAAVHALQTASTATADAPETASQATANARTAVTAVVAAIRAARDAPTTAPAAPRSIDLLEFDKVAREEWAKIEALRLSVDTRFAANVRRTGAPAPSKSVHPSSSSAKVGASPAVPAAARQQTGRLNKLSEIEKDYLAAHDGCFTCRQLNAGHRSDTCPSGFPATMPFAVPANWVRVDRFARRNARNDIAAAPVAVIEEEECDVINAFREPYDPFSSDDSDSECVPLRFPTLPVLLSGATRVETVRALADSGASSSFISDRMVEKLGLVTHKLLKPRLAKLAIRNSDSSSPYTITHCVRVPLALANGTWDAGLTFFKVAPLDDYDIILGNPFLFRHNISIHLAPSPRLDRYDRRSRITYDLLAPVYGPENLKLEALGEEGEIDVYAHVMSTIAELERKEARKEQEEKEADEFRAFDHRLREEFKDLFPADLPPVSSYVNDATTAHHIRLIDPSKTVNERGYPVAQRHREAWKRLLDEHIAAGRIRRSSSEFASPAFIIPKKDPTAAPRWVNDYRKLNSNTVKDRTPLPLPDEVLGHCAKAKYWGKIDMTNSFFQTKVAEEDIAKTAVRTPWGLYEWVVMPMGLSNAPATHQRRVSEALKDLLGSICHVYLDDIIIFSDSLEEHRARVRQVLAALRAAGLYCSPKKTDLCTIHCEFLGHVISRKGLQADPAKVARVKEWTVPQKVKEVRGFLGLVQYLRKFIPGLAEHSARLTPLTKKGLVDIQPLWSSETQRHFDAVKLIVTSLPCLQPVDHSDGAAPLWVLTDASKVGVGAVLMQGPTWQEARPCAFYSRQYIAAEHHYPTHEQELLAIVAALKAWRYELMGVHFNVLTDHATLKDFQTQPTLSKRQARWLEHLSDFDYTLSYLPGEKNTVADAMSRFSFPRPERPSVSVATLSETTLGEDVLNNIRNGYTTDPFCVQVLKNLDSLTAVTLEDGLIRFEGRLLVPKVHQLRENILHDAHDALGHFGLRKTYHAVRTAYFWPRLAEDVKAYVRTCDSCQRHKSRTVKLAGRLHPLPIPGRCFSDIAMDFVGPLPPSKGFTRLLVVSCRLSSYVRLIPCHITDSAEDIAKLMYEHWYRFFGIPERIVSDRDRLFVSKFWKALHRLLGTKLQMSTSFHPQTDGKSERANKTVTQLLRAVVNRSQQDWADRLTAVEYAMNATVAESTSKIPFELVLGFTPRITGGSGAASNLPAVDDFASDRKAAVSDARDALIAAKVRQAEQANRQRTDEPTIGVGDEVMVDSSDRRARFKTADDGSRAAKLFPRWDGPYKVISTHPAQSTYRLALPPSDKTHPVFHVSKLKLYKPNDPALFPNREPERPPPVVVEGEEEFTIEHIVEERKVGRGKQYLVRWKGYPESDNSWEPARALQDTEALARWEEGRKEREKGKRGGGV